MSDINDGGPAFPVECYWDGEKTSGIQTSAKSGWETGLSVRDYFAAKAMQAMLTNVNVAEAPNEKISEWSYAMADAMLNARNAPYVPGEKP